MSYSEQKSFEQFCENIDKACDCARDGDVGGFLSHLTTARDLSIEAFEETGNVDALVASMKAQVVLEEVTASDNPVAAMQGSLVDPVGSPANSIAA